MVLENEIDNFMKIVREFLNKMQIGYKCRSPYIKLNVTVETLKIIHFFFEKHWIKLYRIENNTILVYLRYVNNKPLFIKIKFISTPGLKRYFTNKGVSIFCKNLGGSGRILLYTSVGLLSSKISQNLSIGGEVSYILYE